MSNFNKRFNFRLSSDQKNKLVALAQDAGKSQSGVIRQLLIAAIVNCKGHIALANRICNDHIHTSIQYGPYTENFVALLGERHMKKLTHMADLFPGVSKAEIVRELIRRAQFENGRAVLSCTWINEVPA